MAILLLSSSTAFAESYWDIKKKSQSAYKSGNKESAIKMVNTFVKKYPKEYKAQNLLAVLHYWSGDHQKAKSILEKIVAQIDYPEATKLLKRVNKKLGTKSNIKKSKMIPTYKSLRAMNKNKDNTDLEKLVLRVESNPYDVQNRMLLSKFYLKLHNYQKSYDYAYEVLKVSPQNVKMKTIKNHLEDKYKLSYSKDTVTESVVDNQKANSLLNKLYKKKDYKAFYEFYKGIKDTHIELAKEDYLNIVHVAIIMKDYAEAKKIMDKGLFPVNKKSVQLAQVLSTMLSQSVASK